MRWYEISSLQFEKDSNTCFIKLKSLINDISGMEREFISEATKNDIQVMPHGQGQFTVFYDNVEVKSSN